ncbi:unnamed protein product, partial [Meganyctiphanes norvegica]
MNSVAKASLRKEIKSKLNSLTKEEKTQQSKIVTSALLSHPVYKKSQRLSIFLSMPDEIQTDSVLKHALENGKKVFIPRYDSSSTYMDMVRLHSWEQYDALPTTRWNIKQPPLDKECEQALNTGGLDLVLIPGLAFTRAGDRMGRGKGYYDTFLEKCKEVSLQPPTTIALAFKESILPEIPIDEKDVPIDIVLAAD